MNFQTLLCRISEEISKNPRDVRAYEDYFGVLRLFEGEDFKAAHDMNKKLRYATGKAVRSTESDLSVLGD